MFGDLCSFQDLHQFFPRFASVRMSNGFCAFSFLTLQIKMSIEDIRLGTVIEFSSIDGAVFCYQLTQTSDSYTQD